MADAVVIGGSEDGVIYAWDLLDGHILEKVGAHNGKVASAVACNGTKQEWASAGADGLSFICIVDRGLTSDRYSQSLGRPTLTHYFLD